MTVILPGSDHVRRLAADIVAKCIRKGTIGGAYCPVDVAAAAFPSTDHGVFDEALDYLDRSRWLMWHKGRACFGLDPHTLPEAIAFASQWASPKRAQLLRLEVKRGISAPPSDAPEREVIIEADEDDEPEYATKEDLRRQVESLKSLILGRSSVGTQDQALAGAVAGLRLDIDRLKDRVGKLETAEVTMQHIKALEARMVPIERATAELAGAAQKLVEHQAEVKTAFENWKSAEGHTCEYPDCDLPASKMVPLYRVQGLNWVAQEGKEGGVCRKHGNVHAGYVVDRRHLPSVQRLARKMPLPNGKYPLVLGDQQAAYALMQALRDQNRIPGSIAMKGGYVTSAEVPFAAKENVRDGPAGQAGIRDLLAKRLGIPPENIEFVNAGDAQEGDIIAHGPDCKGNCRHEEE